MPVVSVSMPNALLEQLDEFADAHEYSGRSELVREGARLLLTEFEDERFDTDQLVGTVTVVYDFGTRSVDRQLTQFRRDYEDEIVSNTHGHVADSCLELFVLDGERETIAAFVGQVRAIERVDHVEYSLVELADDGV